MASSAESLPSISTFRVWIIISGLTFAIGMVHVVAFTFVQAMNQGGEITVTVNEFGEMHLEYIVLIVVAAWVSLAAIYIIEELLLRRPQ